MLNEASAKASEIHALVEKCFSAAMVDAVDVAFFLHKDTRIEWILCTACPLIFVGQMCWCHMNRFLGQNTGVFSKRKQYPKIVKRKI